MPETVIAFEHGKRFVLIRMMKRAVRLFLRVFAESFPRHQLREWQPTLSLSDFFF
jgi:hypothetical protein